MTDLNTPTASDLLTPGLTETPADSEVGGASTSELAIWCKAGVKVELTHGQYTGQRATILAPGGVCKVVLDGGGGEIEVDVGELSAVMPEVNSSVLVLSGDESQKGKVIGIDDDDVIVKIDQDGDLQVFEMGQLAVC